MARLLERLQSRDASAKKYKVCRCAQSFLCKLRYRRESKGVTLACLMQLQEAARALKGRALEALKAGAASHAEAQQMQAQLAVATAEKEVPAARTLQVLAGLGHAL